MYYRSQFQRFQSVVSAVPLFAGSQSIMSEKVEDLSGGRKGIGEQETGRGRNCRPIQPPAACPSRVHPLQLGHFSASHSLPAAHQFMNPSTDQSFHEVRSLSRYQSPCF